MKWLSRGVPLGVLVVGLAAALLWGAIKHSPIPGAGTLVRDTRDRGRIALVGDVDPRLVGDGSEAVLLDAVPRLARALDGADEDAVVRAMENTGVGALLAEARPTPGESVRARLMRLESLSAFAGSSLAPRAALYVRREPLVLTARQQAQLGLAARGLMAGHRAPSADAFPEPFRAPRSVEVLVMLRDQGSPRLWRSSRGGSIATALLTAAQVARQRWRERETAMGGPLDQRLPLMDIEVYLLREDGTIGDHSPAFVDRAVREVHGVGFETHSAWHYFLPEKTVHEGRGSAVRAYRRLFEENGVDGDGFARSDVRLYRLVAELAGESRVSR